MRKADLARLLAGRTEGIFIAPFEHGQQLRDFESEDREFESLRARHLVQRLAC
jgi:hypothetical protein